IEVEATISRRADPSRAPLSRAQERLWVLHQLDPASTAYNEQLVLGIQGPLDVEVLRTSFAAVIERHEILRTNFPVDADGRPYQRVLGTIDLPFVVTAAEPSADFDSQLSLHAERERGRSFDFVSGPLFNIQLLVRSPHEHAFILTIHHIISDGWSVAILAREL